MKKKGKEPSINYSQSGEEAAYADYVRVVTGKRGSLLIFGQLHPDRENEVLCVKQIFISPDVAGSLLAILLDHVSRWEGKYEQKITPSSLEVEPYIEEVQDK